MSDPLHPRQHLVTSVFFLILAILIDSSGLILMVPSQDGSHLWGLQSLTGVASGLSHCSSFPNTVYTVMCAVWHFDDGKRGS